MPRNGSGVFSPPSNSFSPAVSTTTIDPADWNTDLADISAAITQSVSSDGQTTITANLPMATFRHTGVGNGVAATDYAAFGQVTSTALNSQGDSYAASGMPGNITLASISGAPLAAPRYQVAVTFHGTVNNTNGTAFAPQITVAVKDGASTLKSRQWNAAGSGNFANGFNDRIAFTVVFDVAVPAAGSYTIVVSDTEIDGATHTWSNVVVSASANIS